MEEEHWQVALAAVVPSMHSPLHWSVYVPHAANGSGADLQLKPSFDCVGSTAACTHLSVTGVGAGDCIGTCEQTWRPDQSHASPPVRSSTEVSELSSTSKMPEPVFDEK